MTAVYKREMRAFFTMPTGYVFIAAFTIVMNLLFYFGNVKSSYSDITVLFPFMLIVLMVLVPIVTMRLLSEEFKMRTDQLLLTSPLSVWDIVLGKFFAAFSLFLISLICTLTWPVIVAMYSIPNTAAVIGCYVGVIFAAAAFFALGLFISSLTESQIIAAIVSFAAFLAIFLLDAIASSIISINWVKTVISWFSIFSRFDNFARGIFSLADVLYYISFTAVFLFLTTRVLDKKRWS